MHSNEINISECFPLLVFENQEEKGVLQGYIVGLTDFGKQEKNLVISDIIKSVEIFGLGYRQEVIESLVLENCYFNDKSNWKLIENSYLNVPNTSIF